MPWLTKKRFSHLALFVSMLLPFDYPILANAQDANTVQVYLQQDKVSWDQLPYIENGSTMVPMRALFEKLGFTVSWDQSTQTASAKKGDLTLTLTINKGTAAVNQNQHNLEVTPKIKDGSTFIPLRFVSEAAGADVTWNEETRAVNIDFPATNPEQRIRKLIDSMVQSSSFTQTAMAITEADGIKKNELNITNISMNANGAAATVTFDAGFTVSKAVKTGSGVTISPTETAVYQFKCQVYKDAAGQWLLSTSTSGMTYELKDKKPFMEAQ
ncbi:copper amine oxidase N-terminal domain-containing protein [Paenibacillus sp. UNC451MF]|uniref:copper amine oxidase N-terminal domain-containing protein n=1 Tax=Paenibacillus sp. UNC451MF TaxID=1449063 RepID=UPI00048E5F81|nr:copper amine oxidase N-terminal domain-containing protein [Paenibacillus sp. UNC451MF]